MPDIVCHHCGKTKAQAQQCRNDVFIKAYFGPKDHCDCSDWWIANQLDLGLTPTVRQWDHGFEVTW